MPFQPEILFGVGTLIVLCALVWGLIQYRTRNRANDPITDEATRELYEHPDTYDETRKALNRKLKPE